MTKVEVHPVSIALLLAGVVVLALMLAYPAEPRVPAGIYSQANPVTDDYVSCADRELEPGETICIDLLVNFPLTHVLCFDVPDDPDTLGRLCGTIGEFRAALAAVME